MGRPDRHRPGTGEVRGPAPAPQAGLDRPGRLADRVGARFRLPIPEAGAGPRGGVIRPFGRGSAKVDAADRALPRPIKNVSAATVPYRNVGAPWGARSATHSCGTG